MAEEIIKPPKVFISYAWEDDVKPWVRAFAKRLRKDGVETVLDLWETDYGDQLPEFMEKAVRESDFVILICTPKYKRKSDDRQGGVGYEGHIITAEIFAKSNHRKFIPVLRKGNWSSASPSWAAGKLYIDLSGNPYDEDNYRDLLRTLHGKKPTPPPVGKPPEFPDEDDEHPKKSKPRVSVSKDDADKFIASLRERFLSGQVRLENDQIQPNLPDRLEVYRMAVNFGLFSNQPHGTPTEVGNVANHQCNPVCSSYGLSMAHDAQRPATVANRLWLLSPMEEARSLGTHK